MNEDYNHESKNARDELNNINFRRNVNFYLYPIPLHPSLYASEIRNCDIYSVGFANNQQTTAHRRGSK